jgi:methionine synthase I (cobalamin-dependent)
MNRLAWAATALQTHPYTVRLLHGGYIRAGVDIITVNSYSAARHGLVPIGFSDMTHDSTCARRAGRRRATAAPGAAVTSPARYRTTECARAAKRRGGRGLLH